MSEQAAEVGKPAAAAPGSLPPPGRVLTRAYTGRVLQVLVLERGFQFDGKEHASLSAVAKAATGTHLSGVAFFGLRGKGVAR